MTIAVEFDPATGQVTHGVDRYGNSVALKPSEAARAKAKAAAEAPAPLTEEERLAGRADVRRRVAEREAVAGELRRLDDMIHAWLETLTNRDDANYPTPEIREARNLRDELNERAPRVDERGELFKLGRADLLLAARVARSREHWASLRLAAAKKADDAAPNEFTAAEVADARAEHSRTQQLYGVAYWAIVNE